MASQAPGGPLQNISGISLPGDACIVLVKTEWNHHITNELEKGALTVLHNTHVNVHTYVVPGAVEIPFAVRRIYHNHVPVPHAIIALGCVIQGDTPHFDYVCRSVTDGITSLNLQLPVPVIMGVLTVLTEQQAQERIGGLHGHKGEEAAITALKMLAFNHSFSKTT